MQRDDRKFLSSYTRGIASNTSEAIGFAITLLDNGKKMKGKEFKILSSNFSRLQMIPTHLYGILLN